MSFAGLFNARWLWGLGHPQGGAAPRGNFTNKSEAVTCRL